MFYEDTDFAFKALPLVRRIALHNKVCYYYLQRENSIVHNFSEKKMDDICVNISNARQYYCKNVKNKKLAIFYKKSYSQFTLMLIKELAKTQNNNNLKNKLLHFIYQEQIKSIYISGNIVTKLTAITFNLLGVNVATFIAYEAIRFKNHISTLNILEYIKIKFSTYSTRNLLHTILNKFSQL